jgi:bidirectional [NiFe] hydrogenase diaphorase subunit
MNNEELFKIAEKERQEQAQFKHIIHICAGTGCVSSSSPQILEELQKGIKARGLEKEVQAKQVGCMGLCAAGPIISIMPDQIIYKSVTPQDASEILDSLDKEPVSRLLISTDLPFFTRQVKNVLENSGKVNPEKIEDYIAVNGYTALAKVLTSMTPNDVIKELITSGLRGRGGGGFTTGAKWEMVHNAKGNQKYIICNADEGDPGAFMDRSVLESDPHVVLEGMAIAAYTVGANTGYIYVRAEYPLAVKRLRTAIRQADKLGLLGKNIYGTDFNFSIELRLGAGAFVCGEETALMNSIEGNRGAPKARPPYPAESGLFGCPTLINNVETLANIPNIINHGGESYAKTGTSKSKGTKVFALTGKIEHTGLIEVPMGITLREIVYDIGGGIPNGHKFKAIQTGGPSGGCIPEEYLDTPVDYESLMSLGAMMGSGGMIVIDDTSNMIDMAKFFIEFTMEESCGKCVPCRVGTERIYKLLSKFSAGEATEEDLTTLEILCDMVRTTSLCGLGKSAPNPVLSTLKYFRHEYLEKIKKPAKIASKAELTV